MKNCPRCQTIFPNKEPIGRWPPYPYYICKCGLESDLHYEIFLYRDFMKKHFDLCWQPRNNKCVYAEYFDERAIHMPLLPFDITEERFKKLLIFT